MSVKEAMTNKKTYVKTLYVVVWSLALMYASFPDIFSKKGFDWNFQEVFTNDAKAHYIFPYILAMALFLIDTIYAFALETSYGKQENVISVLIGVVVFMFCFLLSLSGGECKFFLMGWMALTFIKWVKTEPFDYKNHIPTVMEVFEN